MSAHREIFKKIPHGGGGPRRRFSINSGQGEGMQGCEGEEAALCAEAFSAFGFVGGLPFRSQAWGNVVFAQHHGEFLVIKDSEVRGV